jgi:hypothetical protein
MKTWNVGTIRSADIDHDDVAAGPGRTRILVLVIDVEHVWPPSPALRSLERDP